MIIPAAGQEPVEQEMEDLSQPVEALSDEEGFPAENNPFPNQLGGEEEEEEKKQQFDNFEVGEHIDCLDTYDKWLNAEVVQKRNGQLKVHYSGYAFKYDEWLPQDSPRLLKQWRRGKHL